MCERVGSGGLVKKTIYPLTKRISIFIEFKYFDFTWEFYLYTLIVIRNNNTELIIERYEY